jgi:anti-sigma B factor antagonist
MSLILLTRPIGDVTLVKATGRITMGEEEAELCTTLRDLIESGQSRLILNMREVSYIDSSSLGVLVSSFTNATNHEGGGLKLLNLTPRVEAILRREKLLSIFEVFDDEAAAVRSFTNISPKPQPKPEAQSRWPKPNLWHGTGSTGW